MKTEEGKKEVEELLNSELEQVEGGACQCDSGAGQIIYTLPDNAELGQNVREI